MKTKTKNLNANETVIPSPTVTIGLTPSVLGILTEAAAERHWTVKQAAEEFLKSVALCDWKNEGFPA